MISTTEVSKLLNISNSAIQKATKNNLLHSVNSGNYKMYNYSQVVKMSLIKTLVFKFRYTYTEVRNINGINSSLNIILNNLPGLIKRRFDFYLNIIENKCIVTNYYVSKSDMSYYIVINALYLFEFARRKE